VTISEQLRQIRQLADSLTAGPQLYRQVKALRSALTKLNGAAAKPPADQPDIRPDPASPEYWQTYAERCKRTASRWRKRGWNDYSRWLADHPGVAVGRVLSVSPHHYWVDEYGCGWSYGDFDAKAAGYAGRVEITQTEYLEWWRTQDDHPENRFRQGCKQYGGYTSNSGGKLVSHQVVEIRLSADPVTYTPPQTADQPTTEPETRRVLVRGKWYTVPV